MNKQIEVISCLYAYQLQAQVNEAIERINIEDCGENYIEDIVYLSQTEIQDNKVVGRFQAIITYY